MNGTEKRPAPSRFWSAYAAVYDTIWDSPLTRSLATYVVEALGGPGLDVVDLGCGTGLLSQHFTGGRTGVDSAPAMLRRAVARGRIDWAHEGDILATGLPTGSAPAVIVGNVLHLHPDPRAVVDEARRVCAPEGRIFLCWPVTGLETTRMRRIERRHGRRVVSTWGAHILRTGIGILGALSPGVRPHPVDTSDFLDVDQDRILLDAVFAECQRVVVLQRSAGAVLSASTRHTHREVTQS